MATVIRNTDPVLKSVCDLHNAMKAQVGAGAKFHLDASERVVTAANASSLATSLALVNQIKDVYEFHCADELAHKEADATNVLSEPEATDLATAVALANEIKAAYTAHIADTGVNYNADATNTITAADATDQTSLNTLLNELKGDLNAHMADAPSAPSARLVGA